MPRQPELVRAPQVSTAVDAAPSTAVRPTPKQSAADAARRGRWKIWGWTFGVALPLAAVNLIGAPYYLEPMALRVRHPWHAMLRPSGTVGLTAGIIAVAIFIFLWLYPLRKVQAPRLPRLARQMDGRARRHGAGDAPPAGDSRDLARRWRDRSRPCSR
ncbi:MAG: hypothetical protein IPP98_10140 [Gemmatimonadetes bacterium]|nr:hypothetical protein [Gemmatimonadota bacterium]